jgi:hypothetical protein
MTREDHQSLALTRLSLTKAAEAWPEAKAILRRNIQTMRAAESCADKYLLRLEQLAEQGFDQFSEVLLRENDEGQVLRSVAVLSGILTQDERLEIIRRSYAGHYDR